MRPNHLPPYAACIGCGEPLRAALSLSPDGRARCRNCRAGARAKQRGVCLVCGCDDLPLERHHLAGRRQMADAAYTLPICWSCHAVLSQRQYDGWPRDRSRYTTERSAYAYLFLGLLDVLRLGVVRRRLATLAQPAIAQPSMHPLASLLLACLTLVHTLLTLPTPPGELDVWPWAEIDAVLRIAA